MQEAKPDFLYHYTSLESLAMILKSKTIRFSPLTDLDDTEEQKCIGDLPLGKYVFVSSWTAEEKESIPMWHMYTGLNQGVRIKLRKLPFKSYKIPREQLLPFGVKINGDQINTFVPADKMFGEKYSILHWDYENTLQPITYEPIKSDIEALTIRDNKFSVGLPLLGKNKNDYWAFQKEWRYILNFHPISWKLLNQDDVSIGQKHLLEFNDLPFNKFFLEIDERSLERMEITLSPKISDGAREIVNLLVNKYAPTTIIRESDLQNKLK